MERDKFKTAKELSALLPYSEQYIRAAMNHAEFKTIGARPAYALVEDARRFFATHPEFRFRRKS